MAAMNMKKTMKPNHDLADRVVDACIETLCVLCERWRDEHEFERIDDYRAPLSKSLEGLGVVVESMTKRPFGFRWLGPDGGQRHTFVSGDRVRTRRIG